MLTNPYSQTGNLQKTNISILINFFCVSLFVLGPIKAQTIPDIIFTQIPAKELSITTNEINNYSPKERYAKNCRIVSLVSTEQETTNLTPEFYSASDPAISFDGKYIVFAGKKTAKDFWQIWKMKVDGSEKNQVTKEDGDCVMPVYAGNRFYLNDPSPTPQIIYAGTAHNWENNLESGKVYSLYGTDLQGETIHRLTFNLYNDFSPNVLPNGRVVFSSRQFSDEEELPNGKLAFFVINNDGTDLMPFYGNHEQPVNKIDVHLSDTNQSIYFIESDKTDILGGGNIAYLSQRRPLHSYEKITRISKGFYLTPCLLPDGNLLVSFRSFKEDDVYTLYYLNSVTGEREKLLLKTPGWHNLDVQLNASHPKVKGRSNWLIPGADNGVFYCLNSYQTNLDRETTIKHGDFKFVRIIEGIVVENDTAKTHMVDSPQSSLSQVAPSQIIGTAPVENDGSFHVRVPAEIPLSFQMLDENKMMIDRQKTWTWIIGNENRGCIGCHENREMSPPNVLVDAIRKPPVELIPAIENRRTVDYRNQIAPIIRTKCATSQCHISGGILPNLENKRSQSNDFAVYKTLMKPIKSRPQEKYVVPGYAKRSPLVWHLFGERLEDRISYNVTDILAMPPEYPLTDEEKMLFIEWIDLGAHWDLLQYNYQNSKNSQ
jgi:dipeptidyl aminopeptidase/acylaminoacyl peptidase